MANDQLAPLSGFRDYDRPTKDWVVASLRQVFLEFGYRALETPAIERQELLLKNYGAEAQKLLYLFEDNGKRKVGLRYDLTLPLARYVAANWGQLQWPCKRFEIGPVWRAERAQKGRLRQFTQADIDIVGSSSNNAELELLAVLKRSQDLLGLTFQVQLNDRQLVSAIIKKLSIASESERPLLQLLDKKEKITPEELATQLKKLRLSDLQLRKIQAFFLDSVELDEVSQLVGPELTSPLSALLESAKNLGLEAKFVPSMVRGLEYYTSTILECTLEGYPSSVVGGGRYDSLVESLIGQKVPAVGLSFGVDRIVDFLDETTIKTQQPIFIVNINETFEAASALASTLRQKGRAVELFLEPIELGKQIKYADKSGYDEIYIPFEDEWKKGQIVRKNLKSGEQTKLNRDEL